MQKEKITIDQGCEALDLIRRLSPDEYQARRSWIARVSDPAFNMTALDGILTSSTYGPKIKPPFDGAILDQDGPGDEMFDVGRLLLVPILRDGESRTNGEEAVRRGQASPETNWGQRAMERVWATRESIPESVWSIGVYVVFVKTVWRDHVGGRYVWFIRRENGWRRDCRWLDSGVDSHGLFSSLRPSTSRCGASK